MGKFINKFKKGTSVINDNAKKFDSKINKMINKPSSSTGSYDNKILNKKNSNSMGEGVYDGMEDEFDEDYGMMDEGRNDYGDDYGVGIQPAQKPESFHHFILENKYQDLEKSIRGYKDVYNKTTREWETKRKELHCFTDEEAEELLRTAQSLLATDIKLSFINKDIFGYRMMMLYKRIGQIFREIAEYRYGRYSHNKDGSEKVNGYAIEQSMKLQNLKIFVELTERVVANYSRAIQGIENKLTHQSVKGQESLQSSDRIGDINRRLS